jgi:hypothetical protein
MMTVVGMAASRNTVAVASEMPLMCDTNRGKKSIRVILRPFSEW